MSRQDRLPGRTGRATTLYAARMYRAAATNYAGAAITQVPFDTIDYDYAGGCTTGAAAKYTVPMYGLYEVNASTEFGIASNPETDTIYIYKNGVAQDAGNIVTVRGGTAGDQYGLVAADFLLFAAGDTVDIRFGTSGGNPIAATAGIGRTFFAIRKV